MTGSQAYLVFTTDWRDENDGFNVYYDFTKDEVTKGKGEFYPPTSYFLGSYDDNPWSRVVFLRQFLSHPWVIHW